MYTVFMKSRKHPLKNFFYRHHNFVAASHANFIIVLKIDDKEKQNLAT